MSIYLIRHGKTLANEQRLYCGSSDIPLSDAGRAELTGKHYHVGEDAQYVTSGMKRCNETLRILFGDVPYAVDTDLREIDFGIFELKSYEQLKDDPQYLAWITGDNEQNVPPEGESGAAMDSRVRKAFARYEGRAGDTVIVTHGGVIAAIMESRFPQEGKNRYQWQPKPGCGYVITQEGYAPVESSE